jgi:EmrB/QacA subfamily drug resistance transporter
MRLRAPARHWQVLLVVTAGAFLANLDLFIVNIAFPAIRADFSGASLSALSWVLSGYAIVFAALLVPAGRLADLVGRKRLFLIGLGIFCVASALCAAAPGPWLLVAARVVQAVGAALLIPTSLALLLPEFPPARRAAAVGLWTAGAAVAATLGPTIGGVLVTATWRWVFLVNLPLGVITGIAAIRVLRESRDTARARRPDLAGALLLCLGVGALALGIVKGGEWGWTSAATLGSEAAAILLLAAFAGRSAHHPAPVVEPALLRPRATRAANVSVLIFSMAFFGLLLATVLFLTEIWGYSVLEAGIAFAPGPLMVALLSWPAGTLAGRVGPRPLALAGVLLFAAGCGWWLWRVGAEPAYAADLLPGIILSGIGVSLTFPILAGAAVAALPPERSATGSAVFNMARQIGGVIGVAILVAILGEGSPTLGGFRAGWAFMAVAAIAAGVAAAFLPRAVVTARRVAPAPGSGQLGEPLEDRAPLGVGQPVERRLEAREDLVEVGAACALGEHHPAGSGDLGAGELVRPAVDGGIRPLGGLAVREGGRHRPAR